MNLKPMIVAALMIPAIGILSALAQVSGSADHLSQSVAHSGHAVRHASVGAVKSTASDKVVMYGTDWCTYCDKAKEYFYE